MKQIVKYVGFVLVAAALVFGCSNPLISKLASDLVLSLGIFNAVEGTTQVRGALSGAIDVPVTIVDQTGREATGDYSVTFTLSVDSDLATTADNIAVGTVTVTAGSEQVVSLTVPASAVAGLYELFGVLDNDDAAANNNTSYVTVDIGATNEPDLEVTLSGTVITAIAGEAVQMGFRVDNTGYAKIASGTAVKVSASVDLSGVPTEIGTASVTLESDLVPQDYVTGMLEITAPTLQQMADDLGIAVEALTLWTDLVTVTVDPDDTITEIVEGGTDTFTLTSGNRLPDFEPEIILPDDFTVAAHESAIELAVEITNDGSAVGSGYGLDLYVDINGNLSYDSGTDVMLHQWDTSATPSVPYDLSGSGNNTAYISTDELDLTYPTSIPVGSYRFIAEITGTVIEYDYGNNQDTTPLQQFASADADLSMKFMESSLAAVIDSTAGGSVPLEYFIQNSGRSQVDTDFTVEFYASVDNTLTPAGDILIATDSVTGSVPGEGMLQETVTAAIPGGTTAGFYTVYWVIDSGSATGDYDTANNTISTANGNSYVFVPVSDGAADLSTRWLLYNPFGSTNAYLSMRWYLRDASGTQLESAIFSSTVPAGSLVGTDGFNDVIVGTNILEAVPWSSVDDYPYAFRMVPNYVYSLPGNAAIPYAVPNPDSYELNNTLNTAKPASPLFGFINAYLEEDGTDFYSFTF